MDWIIADMINCILAIDLLFSVFLRTCVLAMSHARTNQNTGAWSLLVSDRGLIWAYTANAVTVSKKQSVCAPVGMANCIPTESAAIRGTRICEFGSIRFAAQSTQQGLNFCQAEVQNSAPKKALKAVIRSRKGDTDGDQGQDRYHSSEKA